MELDREMQLSIHDHFEKRKTQAGGPFSLPRYASLPAPSHKVGRVCFRWLRRNVSFAVGIGASAMAVQEHPALVHMVLRSEVCPLSRALYSCRLTDESSIATGSLQRCGPGLRRLALSIPE